MQNFSIIILAQESNQYHHLGDLAPFGGTTLLEWKIAQCLNFCDSKNIFVSAISEKIEQIAGNMKVNFIARKHECFKQSLEYAASKIASENFFWIQVTTPFMDKDDYLKMYKNFIEGQYERLISAKEEREYFFMQGKKINFSEHVGRSEVLPLMQIVNGCFIFKKDKFSCHKIFNEEGLELFPLRGMSTIEIKEVGDYLMMRDLISTYFKKKAGDFL